MARGNMPDYLNDSVYHGLKSLDNVEVYSNSDLWYMYDDLTVQDKSNLFGKGFTLYGRIPAVKRSCVLKGMIKLDLVRLIRERFFDLVIYGSVWRCRSLLNLVTKYYEKERIFLMDGEDHTQLKPIAPLGVYFKRENLEKENPEIHPISFAIPEDLVVKSVPVKEKFWATVIPGNLATYVFDAEDEYYSDYQKSRFGITTKKGGWDCLRHYEILMNGCVPFFPFIEKCPPKAIASFPKEEARKVFDMINQNGFSDDLYQEKAHYFLEYTRENLTTKKLAKYVLSFLP